MAYKASMLERFHRSFSSRIRTDSNTLIRTTGIAANLESLYLFNGEARSRPAVIPNLIQDKFHIDMTWNGDGYLLGDGGIKLADNGNANTNTAGVVRDIDAAWATSKANKSRVFVLNLEWKSQSITECHIIRTNGFVFYRGSGTVFYIWIENASSHRFIWTIDTTAFKDGDPITIVAMADYRVGFQTSRCYINGLDLGTGTLNGDPFNSSIPGIMLGNYIGRTSFTNYYGYDGKIGLFAHSFEFPENTPPSNADLKALSIDPYRILLNTQKSRIDLPQIVLPAASDWEIEFEARCGLLPLDSAPVPILTASDYMPNNSRCVNLQAAGNNAYLSLPVWNRQFGVGARWYAEIEFEVVERISGFVYLFNSSSSTVTSLLRVNPDGTMAVRISSNEVLTTAPDTIRPFVKYRARLAREDDVEAKLYINDVLVGQCPIGDISANQVNQVARYSVTTVRNFLLIHKVALVNLAGDGGSGSTYYSEVWDSTSMPVGDFDKTWPSVNGTANITIEGAAQELDPYYSRTPLMTGLFTNNEGQLIWSEGTNNYIAGTGFSAAMKYSTGANRYWTLGSTWTGAASTAWSVEAQFLITANLITSAWTLQLMGNNGSSSLLLCTINSSQTEMVITTRNSAAATVNTTASIPFDHDKWHTVKLEATGTNWIVSFDGVPVSTVASTAATSAQMWALVSTISQGSARVACKKYAMTGGTYTEVWDDTTGTGRGTVWTSVSGARTMSASLLDVELWYDTYQRRFTTQSDTIIPHERHVYKISKVGQVFTVRRDETQILENQWKQVKDMYIDRMSNVSSNGIEFGQRIHLYSLRVGSETWTPTATGLVSSVSSGRDAICNGTAFVQIPDPYIYCPTNGQTYANFTAIPQEVRDLTNVVFEVSGFVREADSTVRLYQTSRTSITVKAVAGQEFQGRIYDDETATWSTPYSSNAEQAFSCGSNATLEVRDILMISTWSGTTGTVGTYGWGSNQIMTLNNVGALSRYTAFRTMDFLSFNAGSNNVATVNNCVLVGSSGLRSNETSLTVNRSTIVVNHPTSTSTVAFASGPTVANNCIAVKSKFSTLPAVSSTTTIANTAANDGSGNYGLFASTESFVDAEYGDYRLKDGGLKASGIGAFSTITPYSGSVLEFTDNGFELGDVYGSAAFFDYNEGSLVIWDGNATFESVNVSASAFSTREIASSGFTSTNPNTSTFTSHEKSTSGFVSANASTASFGTRSIKRTAASSVNTSTTTFATRERASSGFASANTNVSTFVSRETTRSAFTSANNQVVSFGTKALKRSAISSVNVSVSNFDTGGGLTSIFTSANTSTTTFTTRERASSGFASANTQVISFGAIEVNRLAFTSANTNTSSFTTRVRDRSAFTSANATTAAFNTREVKLSTVVSANASTASFTTRGVDKAAVISTNASVVSFMTKELSTAGFGSANANASTFTTRERASSGFASANTSTTVVNVFDANVRFTSNNTSTSTFVSLERQRTTFGSASVSTASFGAIANEKTGFISSQASVNNFATKGLDKSGFTSANVNASSFVGRNQRRSAIASVNTSTSVVTTRKKGVSAFTSSNLVVDWFNTKTSAITTLNSSSNNTLSVFTAKEYMFAGFGSGTTWSAEFAPSLRVRATFTSDNMSDAFFVPETVQGEQLVCVVELTASIEQYIYLDGEVMQMELMTGALTRL